MTHKRKSICAWPVSRTDRGNRQERNISPNVTKNSCKEKNRIYKINTKRLIYYLGPERPTRETDNAEGTRQAKSKN